MKTIKIFLASSEELKNDRVSFGNFIRELDKRYQQRGIRIDLYTWEGADGAYNGRRKQDEYNENVRDSDMLVALFYIKAGGFTQEEFHEAVKSYNDTGRPKVYVYFRQLEDESKVSEELKKFKEELEGQDAKGHFASRYSNDDSLHLNFVMQLLMQEKILNDKPNIEEGQVMLNGVVIAHMDNLDYVSDNKVYKKLIEDLEKVEFEFNQLREAYVQVPNDTIKYLFENKKEEFKQKKADLEKYQTNLLNLALASFHVQKNNITLVIQKAIEAINTGDISKADKLLDKAGGNSKFVFKQLEDAQELAYTEIERKILTASVKMLNTKIPIEERIILAKKEYEDAIYYARKYRYDESKYADLLFVFCDFLQDYGYYKDALMYCKDLVEMRKKIHGDGSLLTADAYTKLGFIYDCNKMYNDSLESLNLALNILKDPNYGTNMLEVAKVYNNMGNTYNSNKEYDRAIKWYREALAIREELNKNSFDTSCSYHNIAIALNNQGKKEEALKSMLKAIEIKEAIFKNSDRRLAFSYDYISDIYRDLNMRDTSLEFMKKACGLYEKYWGYKNPYTLRLYFNIAYTYYINKDYTKSDIWFRKSIKQGDKRVKELLGLIRRYGWGNEKQFAIELHRYSQEITPMTLSHAMCCKPMGKKIKPESKRIDDYNKIIELHYKASEEGSIQAHIELSRRYYKMGDFEEALPWAEMSVQLYPGNPNIIETLADIYEGLERYDEAVEQYELCLRYYEEQNIKRDINRIEKKITALNAIMRKQ